MLDPLIQERARFRPNGEPAMFQSWTDLGFFHFPADPDLVQSNLPKGLTVDTYPDDNGTERAWLGLVAFAMHGIRPTFLPAAPWISAFLETNVRTYAHRDGENPGVYFYTLDAERRLACEVARLGFGLNYMHSIMSMDRTGDQCDYRIHRLDEPHASMRLTYEIGDQLASPKPGSLEYFFAERYLLYSERNGKLGIGRVWHEPYPLRSAAVIDLKSDLFESIGLKSGSLAHSMFSPGVDVEVFPFENLAIL